MEKCKDICCAFAAPRRRGDLDITRWDVHVLTDIGIRDNILRYQLVYTAVLDYISQVISRELMLEVDIR